MPHGVQQPAPRPCLARRFGLSPVGLWCAGARPADRLGAGLFALSWERRWESTRLGAALRGTGRAQPPRGQHRAGGETKGQGVPCHGPGDLGELGESGSTAGMGALGEWGGGEVALGQPRPRGQRAVPRFGGWVGALAPWAPRALLPQGLSTSQQGPEPSSVPLRGRAASSLPAAQPPSFSPFPRSALSQRGAGLSSAPALPARERTRGLGAPLRPCFILRWVASCGF